MTVDALNFDADTAPTDGRDSTAKQWRDGGGTFPLRRLAARASGWHSSPVATAKLRSALAQFAAFARSLKGNEKRRSIYAWRGETDKASEWLQVSFDNHDTGTLSLLIDPLMRGLHHDARYNGLLAKIGLPVSL